jgi:UDP-glucose 6-dehydrogenase
MENPLKRFDVVVVRVGYVGLVTGATLSHFGHRVTCVDRDEERSSALSSLAITLHSKPCRLAFL